MAYTRGLAREMQSSRQKSISENGLFGASHLMSSTRRSRRTSELGGTIDRISSIAFPSVSVNISNIAVKFSTFILTNEAIFEKFKEIKS